MTAAADAAPAGGEDAIGRIEEQEGPGAFRHDRRPVTQAGDFPNQLILTALLLSAGMAAFIYILFRNILDLTGYRI